MDQPHRLLYTPVLVRRNQGKEAVIQSRESCGGGATVPHYRASSSACESQGLRTAPLLDLVPADAPLRSTGMGILRPMTPPPDSRRPNSVGPLSGSGAVSDRSARSGCGKGTSGSEAPGDSNLPTISAPVGCVSAGARDERWGGFAVLPAGRVRADGESAAPGVDTTCGEDGSAAAVGVTMAKNATTAPAVVAAACLKTEVFISPSRWCISPDFSPRHFGYPCNRVLR